MTPTDQLPANLLLACDGLPDLEAAALREWLAGTSAEQIVAATRELVGLPSDLDGGTSAAALAATLAQLNPAQRAFIAELALAPEGLSLTDLAAQRALDRRAVEAIAQSIIPYQLVRWQIASLRLARPLAATVCNLTELAPELQLAFAALVRRLAARDAVAPRPIEPATWHNIAHAVERLQLAPEIHWRALQLLADTALSDERREALSRLATRSANHPASHLLRARLLRQAGDLQGALQLTRPLVSHPQLSVAAKLEQARGLYALGRLTEASHLLEASAHSLEPLDASNALRTSAAIRLALDDASGARTIALRSLHLTREHGLTIAEARTQGLLATIEAADLALERSLEHARRASVNFALEGDPYDQASASVTTAQTLIGLRRYDEANDLLAEAHQKFLMLHSRSMLATSASLQALAAMDRGEMERARTHIEAAIVAIDERQPRSYAWTSGIFAILLLQEGRAEEAALRLKTVVETFSDMQDLHHARLFSAFAQLSGSARLPAGERGSATTRELDRALTSPPAPREGLWTRLLRATRAQLDRGLVMRSGAGFSVPDRAPVDLSKRPTLKRLLAALVVAMEAGEACTTDRLFEAGWKGEPALPDAARARVYVALSELRSRGLSTFLLRDGDGYRLRGLRVVDRDDSR